LYGYAKVARLIASDSEKSGAIFKRFDKLATRNLLYQEAWLAYLERKQDEFDRKDANADGKEQYDLKAAAESYEYFVERAEDDDFAAGPARRELEQRLELARQIKIAIKDYRGSLTSHSNMRGSC